MTTPVSIRPRIEKADRRDWNNEPPQWDTGDEGDMFATIGKVPRTWATIESLVRHIVDESGEAWASAWDWVQDATWEHWIGAEDPTGDYLYLWSKDGSFEHVSWMADDWCPEETFPVTVVIL